MFSVYVLRSSKTGRRYVGSCADLSDRLRRHNAGESQATKHGLPWTLIHEEEFRTRAGKPRENVTSKPVVAVMNWIKLC